MPDRVRSYCAAHQLGDAEVEAPSRLPPPLFLVAPQANLHELTLVLHPEDLRRWWTSYARRKLGSSTTKFSGGAMPRRLPEQQRRYLVHLVVEFAGRSGPIAPADVEAHFVQHPWFRTPVGPIIKGISEAPKASWTLRSAGQVQGTYRPQVGIAVTSGSIIPNPVWTAAPPDAPPLPVSPTWTVWPNKAPYENDRENVRARLRQLVEGEAEAVRSWVRDAANEHPDLVGGMFDWERLEPTLWVGGLQGACLLALAYLAENRDGMLRELRWCESCGPWMPSEGGRPTDLCECGSPRQRVARVPTPS
jgi:hypothetical protein